MAEIVGGANKFRQWEEVANILIKRGKELLAQPPEDWVYAEWYG